MTSDFVLDGVLRAEWRAVMSLSTLHDSAIISCSHIEIVIVKSMPTDLARHIVDTHNAAIKASEKDHG